MKGRLVQTGRSLAVTLPAEVVQALKLEKGQEVEVSIHPLTGIVLIRAGVNYFEDGKVTKRFRSLSERVLRERNAVFRELAK
jgi:virulence-associated protein VagC